MSDSPELYLTIDATDGAVERLAGVLQHHPIACVRVVDPGAGTSRDRAKPIVTQLVAAAHGSGLPVIVDDAPAFAVAVGADGVHLQKTGIETPEDLLARLANAREVLGPDAVIGVSVGPTRHEAMQLGETTVSYLMFEPTLTRDGFTDDELIGEDLEQHLWLERLGWWAEVFEIPAVAAGITTAEEAAEAAATGAEFIELRMPAAISPGDANIWLTAIRTALEPTAEAAS